MKAQFLQIKLAALILLIGLIMSFGGGVEITVLSPEEDQIIQTGDLMAVFSFYSPSGDRINKDRIKLYFDEEEITQNADIGKSYLSFAPDELFLARPDLTGPHSFTIKFFNTSGKLMEERKVSVLVAEPALMPEADKLLPKTSRGRSAIRQKGFFELGNRYDQYALGPSNVLDGRLQYSMKSGEWLVKTNFHLTSDEDELAMPKNQMQLDMSYGKYINLGLGDRYPSYHDYVLSGQRVRGLEMNLKTGFFHMDAVYGKTRMSSELMGWGPNGIEDIGLYGRNLWAINPKFGRGEWFQFGMIILKSRDDVESIDLKTDSLGNILIGDTPKDNLAIGFNMLGAIWERRIQLFGNFAVGLYTDDIRGGVLTEEQAGEFGMEDQVGTLEGMEPFFIINPSSSYMSPSPGDLPQIGIWDAGFRFRLPVKTFTSNTEFKYVMIGPVYRSFGKEAMESSRTGVKVSERLELFQRKLSVNGSFGFYRNNLDELMPEATYFTNYSLGVRVNQMGSVPGFAATFSNNSSVNDDTSQVYGQDRANNNVQLSSFYSRQLGITNNRFSLTFSNNNSMSDGKSQFASNTVGVGVNSGYGDSPLTSRLRFSTNGYDSENQPRHFSLNGGLGYTFLNEQLETGLNVGHLFYSEKTSSRTNSTLNLRYAITKKMDFTVNSGFYLYEDDSKIYAEARYGYHFL